MMTVESVSIKVPSTIRIAQMINSMIIGSLVTVRSEAAIFWGIRLSVRNSPKKMAVPIIRMSPPQIVVASLSVSQTSASRMVRLMTMPTRSA